MKIGLIGLKKSGKTTIFNALTRSQATVDTFEGRRAEPNQATVEVADARVEHLVQMYQPRKTTRATVEFVDFVGLSASEEKGEVFSASDLGLIKTMDALALVLRGFEHPVISSTYGAPDPKREVEQLSAELVLSDLIIAENRRERICHNLKRGVKSPAQDAEMQALEKVLACLNDNRPAAAAGLSPEEQRHLRGFQFLTLKPLMVILNSDEQGFASHADLLAILGESHPAIEFAGRFEMELGGLDEDEARLFMDDMHISSSARDRLTVLAYEVLGYLTFFTVGSDEVRAWTIRSGATALDAAGAIHSDLARGFIRAECFTYEDLKRHGSEKALTQQGLMRLEGRDYRVQDGDILSIRFSV